MTRRHRRLGHHTSYFCTRLGLVKGLRWDLRWAPTALRAADALDDPSANARPPHLRDGPGFMDNGGVGLIDANERDGSTFFVNIASITPSVGAPIGRHATESIVLTVFATELPCIWSAVLLLGACERIRVVGCRQNQHIPDCRSGVLVGESVVATLGADKMRIPCLFKGPGVHHCLAADFPPNYTVTLNDPCHAASLCGDGCDAISLVCAVPLRCAATPGA
jgi:hypothetical protein